VTIRISIETMIEFVERDIISRRRVYAKLVNQGKLSQNAAEFNLHVMDNVLILLRKQL
jgi:hypothetical protein